jgi:hypothetical protein
MHFQTRPEETPLNEEQDGIIRFKEQQAIVRETLSGYAYAADIVEQERMERLARMTPEEARAIYEDLCHTGMAQRQRMTKEELERLEQWRLETLLSVRDAMARMWVKRKQERR